MNGNQLTDRLDNCPEVGLLDECARRDDMANLRATAGRPQIARARGIIQHGNDASRLLNGEEGDARRIGIGQHKPDAVAGLTELAEPARENSCADLDLAGAEGTGQRIFEHYLRRIAAGKARVQCLCERGFGGTRGENEIGHDVIERRTGGLAAFASKQFLIDGKLSWRHECHAHLRKKPAPDELRRKAGKGCAFEPLKPHRHDHGIGLVGNHGGAVIDLHERAGDGEPPFGKDHQTRAFAHLPDQAARGNGLCRIHRIAAGNAEEGLHPPGFGDLPVNREDRLVVEDREDDGRIEK